MPRFAEELRKPLVRHRTTELDGDGELMVLVSESPLGADIGSVLADPLLSASCRAFEHGAVTARRAAHLWEQLSTAWCARANNVHDGRAGTARASVFRRWEQ